ncbi:TANK-binding kinase 1-binding protein 1-like [Hordeum vulgare subsp. vulgare]|uniref:TANK-binding kinase 1-binding protein 1-like n=1 Tax=Hordeum vulgare subsp. vulgare TaxID=112509 RepID=UPI001D1A352E|nr:TANK-binding kinase 1-binding protein 1-like [Hordeum vulgare subsp. vulgare]
MPPEIALVSLKIGDAFEIWEVFGCVTVNALIQPPSLAPPRVGRLPHAPPAPAPHHRRRPPSSTCPSTASSSPRPATDVPATATFVPRSVPRRSSSPRAHLLLRSSPFASGPTQRALLLPSRTRRSCRDASRARPPAPLSGVVSVAAPSAAWLVAVAAGEGWGPRAHEDGAAVSRMRVTAAWIGTTTLIGGVDDDGAPPARSWGASPSVILMASSR